MSALGGNDGESESSRLRNTRLVPAHRTLFEAGHDYDDKVRSGFRHLSVRYQCGYYEAAWELSEMDPQRIHAIGRLRIDAETRLLNHLEDRLK